MADKGWLRPASLGFLDGAVTNLALLGFSLGALPERLLTIGIAGWLAGALSMGVNEYVSVADQNKAEGTKYSPGVAACSSFCAFSVGALAPLVPLFFGAPVWFGLAVGGIGLFTAGSVLAVFTGRGKLTGGVRQLLFGGLACGVTVLVGHLIGVQV